jgi:hypothetical protein
MLSMMILDNSCLSSDSRLARFCKATSTQTRFDIRMMGAARYDIHLSGYPVELVAHDGFRHLRFPDVKWADFEHTMTSVITALCVKYPGTEVVLRDRQNFLY